MPSARRVLLWGLGAPTLLLCLTTVVSHSFGRLTYGLLVPAIEDDLGLTHAQAGVGGTTVYAAYAVGVVVVAIVASRLEPITIMRGGIAMAAAGFVVLATATGFPMLLAGLALAGGAGAGIWVTAPVLATARVAPERRGLVIGLLSATIGLSGFTLGFVTTGIRRLLDDTGAWRPIWGLEAVLSLALLVAIASVVRVERTARVESGLDLRLLRAVPGWWRLTLAYALFGALTAGFGAFLFAALEEDGGLSRASAAAVFSAMGLLGVVGAPTTGWLSDQVGRPLLMAASMTVLTAACLAVALGSAVVAVIGALGYGSLAGSYPALVASYVRDHLDQRAFSRAFASMLVLFSLFAIAAPSAVGAVAETTGSFTAAYGLLALMGAAALGLTLALPGRRPRPSPQGAGPSSPGEQRSAGGDLAIGRRGRGSPTPASPRSRRR